MNQKIVLSGMRPTGALHLGHYYGALINWVRLQKTHQCFFMVADWHALTTHYQESQVIENNTVEMVIDWLACGLCPTEANIFVQSAVPEHSELFLALSMITPNSWLERVPTYKEQQEKLSERDLSTYGFLGYPLLQAADILIYNADAVPVGEDQKSHVELTREIARRFNTIYGKTPDFEKLAKLAQKKFIKEFPESDFEKLKISYQQSGDNSALEIVQILIDKSQWLTSDEKLILKGFFRGGGKQILSDPQVLLTEDAKLPGLDGQKMSKSYNNALSLRESNDEINRKIKTMKTDPQRQRRTDIGNPENCPVWAFHKIYSNEKTKQWANEGCKTAGIGCIECKTPVIESVINFITPLRDKALELAKDKEEVKKILMAGSAKAHERAQTTMNTVKSAIGMIRI